MVGSIWDVSGNSFVAKVAIGGGGGGIFAPVVDGWMMVGC